MGQISRLNYADMMIIEWGTLTLPGVWYLDPIVDLKRPGKPRVWVRPRDAGSSWPEAISFERLGQVVWISMNDPTGINVQIGMPFDTIPAAFIYLRSRLSAKNADGPHGFVRAQSASQMPA
jgi:hypothetical protein